MYVHAYVQYNIYTYTLMSIIIGTLSTQIFYMGIENIYRYVSIEIHVYICLMERKYTCYILQ